MNGGGGEAVRALRERGSDIRCDMGTPHVMLELKSLLSVDPGEAS